MTIQVFLAAFPNWVQQAIPPSEASSQPARSLRLGHLPQEFVSTSLYNSWGEVVRLPELQFFCVSIAEKYRFPFVYFFYFYNFILITSTISAATLTPAVCGGAL